MGLCDNFEIQYGDFVKWLMLSGKYWYRSSCVLLQLSDEEQSNCLALCLHCFTAVVVTLSAVNSQLLWMLKNNKHPKYTMCTFGYHKLKLLSEAKKVSLSVDAIRTSCTREWDASSTSQVLWMLNNNTQSIQCALLVIISISLLKLLSEAKNVSLCGRCYQSQLYWRVRCFIH